MKGKELIRLLREVDPEGETEVCIGNQDILSVDKEAAYCDGCLEVLVRDPSKVPYYDVVGAKYLQHGHKVSLMPHGVEDMLLGNPDAPVDYSDLTDQLAARYRKGNDKAREESRKLARNLEFDLFIAWAERKAEQLCPNYQKDHYREFLQAGYVFFDKNVSPDNPLAPALSEWNEKLQALVIPSYNDRRKEEWDDSVEVAWDGEEFAFRKKEDDDVPKDAL